MKNHVPTASVTEVPPIRYREDEGSGAVKKKEWKNRQRLLIFASRGISFQSRHLLMDLRSLLPHAKSENKMEKKDSLHVINEICEMKNCNKCLFFEGNKRHDLYMWISNIPHGPSVKFFVENIHTLGELKLSGNCLKGSRPILSFDPTFDTEPHWKLLKEVLQQAFCTPKHHPKSQPFIDHILTFTILDDRIWFRNYQIIEEDGSLAEIGPRFVLNPVKVFGGSFGGDTIWENSQFIPPAVFRRRLRNLSTSRPLERAYDRVVQEEKRDTVKAAYTLDPTNDIFLEATHKDEPAPIPMSRKELKRKKHGSKDQRKRSKKKIKSEKYRAFLEKEAEEKS